MREFAPSQFRVTARWVFPISESPIPNGVVEVQSGRIVAVHGRSDSAAIDLGNVALIPGLVNAHSHLEFSDLPSPVEPANPFTAWIRSLVAVRRNLAATRETLQHGLAECHSTGTTLVGEIATQDWPDDAYSKSGMQTVVFRELIGMLPERAAAQLELAKRWLDPVRSDTNEQSRSPNVVRHDARSSTPGLSPHAPYSVHPDLYRDLVRLAAEKQAPIAVHLAETAAELELLRNGTGEFVSFLQAFNAWDPHAIPRGTRPLDYLLPLANVRQALVIHGNYLDEPEMDWLSSHPNVSVVYCPRTHFYFGHTPHPWLNLLQRGINVALGTDSRGSNPDLSLWAELQFLARRFPDLDRAVLLALGTLAGAKALGLDAETGTLQPGKRADLAIVELPPNASGDAYDILFAGPNAVPYRQDRI